MKLRHFLEYLIIKIGILEHFLIIKIESFGTDILAKLMKYDNNYRKQK